MKILVTGGAGFIGSHLSDALVETNQVTVLDNLSVGNKANLKGFKEKGGRLVVGDVRDKDKVNQVIKKIDLVFHLAVQCVRLSFKNPHLLHEVNTGGTLLVLEAVRQAKVKKFVYISSSEVYGTTQKLPISETDPTLPTTIYGASKLAGEYYALAYARSFGIPVVIVRPFNTYGPRAHFAGVYGEVIPKFFIRQLNSKSPIIYGDGKQTRDFTYVSDTVSGIIRSAFVKKAVGEIINIGTGEEIQIRQLANLIGVICRQEVTPIFRPSRPADVLRLKANTEKARILLEFIPKVSLREGLTDYFEWLKNSGTDLKSAFKLNQEENWM